MTILFAFLIITFVIFVIAILYILKSKEVTNEEITDKVILKIAVPKENEKTPLSAEQMFASLHGIIEGKSRAKDPISFEIAGNKEGISFYVVIPKYLRDFVTGQIYAQYPLSEIYESQDYFDDISKYNSVYITNIKLEKKYSLPIKTFENFDVDPLSALTATMTNINGECSIQFVIRPIGNTWQDGSKKYVEKLKGKNMGFTEIMKSQNPEKTNKKEETSFTNEEKVKQIENKILKVGYQIVIRVMAATEQESESRRVVNEIKASFKQFSTPHLNSFIEVTNNDKKSHEKNFIYFKNRFIGKNAKDILNIEELASLYHLPNLSVETPSIHWSKAKKAESPLNLPTEDVTVIGMTNFRETKKKFGIKTDDRRRHMYILGKTGTGKSTMMKNMIISDILRGNGVGVFDPHGELADDVLNFIPNNRINDVVIIDPSDTEHPVSINLLDLKDQHLRDLVADNILAVFKKHFDSWGPRLEYLLHNCILTLLQVDNTSLLGIQRILVDKSYRQKIVSYLKDPILTRFWNEEFESMERNNKLSSEAIAPIQNKVGRFLSSATIRNMVGQVTSTIDLEDIINTKKILIVNLSQGRIGEESTALLGGMLITRLQSAAMQRVKINENDRQDFFLYVDEFQTFATNAFTKILSEARKYRLDLILAHQYIAQLEEEIQNAIFGNVGTSLSFVVGPQDADLLEKEFSPIFTAQDLISLERHNFYIKLMIDGMVSKPFSGTSLDLQYERNTNKEKVIRVSQERYSRSRTEVEDKIQRWNSN
jgi:hypothetical protein